MSGIINIVSSIFEIYLYIIFYYFYYLFLLGPLVLLVFNIINLFKKNKIKEDGIDLLTFTFGFFSSALLFIFKNSHDYYEPLVIGGSGIEDVHNSIASWSMMTVFAIVALGIASYAIIRMRNMEFSPLIIVFSISGILICSAYMVLFMIQISNKNVLEIKNMACLYLFPLNYIFCSIRAIIDVMKRYKKKNIAAKEFDNRFLNLCSKILYNIDTWPVIAIVFAIPLAAVLIGILVLFGQRPDEAIRGFLETSDWNLSQKVSPPPVEYEGHYLCTVSLKGHKKLVKPIRMGIRRGEKIVVNRQLCIANAFEDLIQEKTPRFHHFIRYIYDKYGFPLSKYIKTAWAADITYILMKPLEWIFLIVLYTFDKNPENRISTQYIGKKLKY